MLCENWISIQGEKNDAFYGKISLYVVRQNSNSDYKYIDSAPYERCSRFMKILQIKNIIWSDENGRLSKCRVRDYKTTHISKGNRVYKR